MTRDNGAITHHPWPRKLLRRDNSIDIDAATLVRKTCRMGETEL
jgi:hypothetical protein